MKRYKEKHFNKLELKILNLLHKESVPLNHKQIRKKIGKIKLENKAVFLNILNALVKKKKIFVDENFKFYCRKKNIKTIVRGALEFGAKKELFCLCEETKRLIYIPKKYLNGSLIGDYVAIKLFNNKRKGVEGCVEKILKRNKEVFVGTVFKKGNSCFVVPFDKNVKTDFYIPAEKCLNTKNNDRVIVKILDWPKGAKCPFGKIIERLGESGDLNAELNSIIKTHSIYEGFSEETLSYVKGLTSKLSSKEIKTRKDFRGDCCFTIDPKDAKDFDDAISVKKIKTNLYEIGVHIADVSFYVKPGTAIDQDAVKKGCSIYLSNKVVPMLPEKLANELCSLRPLEEKLCFSIVFNITDRAKIISTWAGKTIIKSKKRFTYEGAQNILDANHGKFLDELRVLDSISRKLRKNRINNGSIIINKKEVFVEFKNGIPLKASSKEVLGTNKLIEEFMLLANQKICNYYTRKTGGVYRVHDKPDPEKLKSLLAFLKRLNLTSILDNKHLSQSINNLLGATKKSDYHYLINQLLLRSMAKAEYSTKNIGHFGLGFKNYSHFTSPIRRYPDILTHRILESILENEKTKMIDLEKQCRLASKKEREAIKAERDYMKFLLIWLIRDKQGEICYATISSVQRWGIYAELEGYLCEGMISLSSLQALGNFYYDNKKNEMINKITGENLSLGQRVCVKINNVNLDRSELDLIIIK